MKKPALDAHNNMSTLHNTIREYNTCVNYYKDISLSDVKERKRGRFIYLNIGTNNISIKSNPWIIVN